MGYHARYELNWIVPDTFIPSCGHYDVVKDKFEFCPYCGAKVGEKDWDTEINKFLQSYPKDSDLYYQLVSRDNDFSWYEQDRDMKLFSRKFPLAVFVLTYSGEDHPDLGVYYYKNGKGYHEDAIITYPEFDESKLE
jgi:hypothetical protein